jgi:ATP-dependent 26S proteasome regulatory subunit
MQPSKNFDNEIVHLSGEPKENVSNNKRKSSEHIEINESSLNDNKKIKIIGPTDIKDKENLVIDLDDNKEPVVALDNKLNEQDKKKSKKYSCGYHEYINNNLIASFYIDSVYVHNNNRMEISNKHKPDNSDDDASDDEDNAITIVHSTPFKNLLLYFSSLVETKDKVKINSIVVNEKREAVSIEYHMLYGSYYNVKLDDEISLRIKYDEIDFMFSDKSSTYKPEYLEVTFSKPVTKKYLNNLFIRASKYSSPPRKKSNISVFQVNDSNTYWDYTFDIRKRDLSTIYLTKKLKDLIISDIDKFFKRKGFYKKNCITHKKTCLLEGLPGAGKSSLITAIASKYNMNIYSMKLTLSMNDNNFSELMSSVPSKSIIVLEDIDNIFVHKAEEISSEKHNISFSGVLNALDGINKKFEIVMFLTTNHIERLDPRIIRAGRIDNIYHFGYISKKQITEMISSLIPEQIKNIPAFIKASSHIKFTTAILQKLILDKLECEDISKEIEHLEKICTQHGENKKNMSYVQ